MNIFDKRIEKLAKKLDSVPNRGFDMTSWMADKEGDPIGPKQLREASKKGHSCGMAACVGGWAVLTFPNLLKADDDGTPIGPRSGYGTSAIGDLLGLCSKHSYKLTAHDANHNTPKKAASYLRALPYIAEECIPCSIQREYHLTSQPH